MSPVIEFVKRWAFVPMLLALGSVVPAIVAPHASTVAKWIVFAVAVLWIGRLWDRRRQRSWPRAGR